MYIVIVMAENYPPRLPCSLESGYCATSLDRWRHSETTHIIVVYSTQYELVEYLHYAKLIRSIYLEGTPSQLFWITRLIIIIVQAMQIQ